MMTPAQFKTAFTSGQPVVVAIVGDSTTGGFGANPGPNVWSGNGLPYGCMNNPSFGPNWDQSSPYALNLSGFPSQSQQDNVGIPSATRLLRTYLEGINSASKVYNFGGSGYTAAAHVAGGTIAALAALTPKPQVAFIALGINIAKNNGGQDSDVRTLVAQAIAQGILPVLVKEHNVAVTGSPAGNWSETATPDQWFPMDNWPGIRASIDQIAADYGLEVVDLGDSTGAVDVTLLYDPFHPSAKGYREIFSRYKNWLAAGAVRVADDSTRYSPIATGALRIKTTAGIVALPLRTLAAGITRIKTTMGEFQL